MEEKPLEFGFRDTSRGGTILLVLLLFICAPAFYFFICALFDIKLAKEHLYLICAVVVPLGLFFLWWVYHWRIVLDGEGVHRRVFVSWQHWPWALFEEGQVRRGDTYFSFKFILQPFFKRKVDFRWAEDHFARRALDICYAHWTPPPRPPLPDEVKFKATVKTVAYQLTPRADRIRVSPAGLWINSRGEMPTYSWSSVTKAAIFRPSREHENFTLLRFEVGERAFKCEWNPARRTSPVIAQYFEAFAPPEAVVICTDDPPQSVREADERIQLLQEKKAAQSMWLAFLVGGSILFKLLFLDDARNPEDHFSFIYLITLMMCTLGFPLVTRHQIHRQIEGLLAKRERLLGESAELAKDKEPA